MESDSRRSEGSGDMSVTKFSVLGNGPYGSSVAVVGEGQGQSNFSLEGPSPAPMNFSFLLKHYPPQSQSQTQTQQSLPSASHNFGNNGGGVGRNEVSGDLAISLGGDVQPRHNQLMIHHPMQVYGLGFSENQACKINIFQKSSSNVNNTASQGFCPQSLLNTLSILQQQIQQLQSLVPLIAQQDRKPGPSASQAFMTASIQSIISQLIAAAAVMLPASQQSCLNLLGIPDLTDLQLGQLGQVATAPNSIQPNGADSLDSSVGMNIFSSLDCGGSGATQPQNHAKSASEITEATKVIGTVSAPASASNCRNGDAMLVSQGSAGAGPGLAAADDNDTCGNSKEDDEDVEGESLPPGSYQLVEMDAREILAEHTHFCEICSKGFKRDANLRMHMRGHGDEYKTPAALARPDKPQDSGPVKPRRYSCPFVGCKRNKEHKKFQPLKTMLCVKNHYRRSHCPKMYTCNRCKIKKFSVVADLKTHEKHCGRDKWQCSCGTTFSRKDKLFGHIGLFQGHTPAFTSNETEGAVPEQVGNSGVAPVIGDSVSGLGSNSGIGGPSYSATANLSSLGSSSSGTAMDNGHGQMGVKNMNYSQEGNAHGMSMESSSTMPVFPATASGMMPGPFMLQSLLSNNYMQHHRN